MLPEDEAGTLKDNDDEGARKLLFRADGGLEMVGTD